VRTTSLHPRSCQIYRYISLRFLAVVQYLSYTMSSNLAASRDLLLDHFASEYFVPGAVLPPAEDDPHPLLSLALHELWEAVRPSYRYTPGEEPVLVTSSPNQTAREIVEGFYPSLVISFFD